MVPIDRQGIEPDSGENGGRRQVTRKLQEILEEWNQVKQDRGKFILALDVPVEIGFRLRTSVDGTDQHILLEIVAESTLKEFEAQQRYVNQVLRADKKPWPAIPGHFSFYEVNLVD